jgi:GntR family transcriptional regulator
MIIIDYRDRKPIYEQIVDRYKELIIKRILEPDTQLPSIRNLAIDLSINPNTIQRAYSELERQKYIYSVKGKGNFVADIDHLIQGNRDEVMNHIEQLLREAKNLGIKQEEILDMVFISYRGGDCS